MKQTNNPERQLRILLINSNRFKHPWPVIPFGLCCVAASIEKAGFFVEVLDLCFSSEPCVDIKKKVEAFRPDVVGVSIRNIDNSAGYNTLFLLEETREKIIIPLKQYFQGPIVIGGPSVGINGAEMLEYLDLPFAVRGDGEAAMVAFLERLQSQKSMDGLQGIVRRVNGKIVENNPPFWVTDLDSLPPARPHRFLDLTTYRRFDSPLQIQTKRGCGLRCSYCTYNRIEGKQCRLRSPMMVADEIAELVKETGIDRIEFTDSTFNVPLRHAKEILRALITKKLNLRLRTMGLNPGAVDEEFVNLLYESGFHEVDLGAESGCDLTLKSLGKNFTTKDILRAGHMLREKGIPITWYLLVGAPGETRETLKETFDTINAAASQWDLVNVGVGVRAYKGAPIAEQMQNDNPLCTEDGFLKPIHYEPSQISLDIIKVITKHTALQHPNYFMYDEDETTPPWVLMAGAWLIKKIAPRQPIWRIHILLRTLQKYLGILFIKRMLYTVKHRDVLGSGEVTDVNCYASK